MQAVPSWWLILTAIIFGIWTLATVLCLVWLGRVLAALRPTIDELLVTMKATGEQLREAVADVQKTTHVVRDKSERMLGTGGVVDVVASRLGLISTVLGVVITLAKARSELSKMKSGGEKPAARKK